MKIPRSNPSPWLPARFMKAMLILFASLGTSLLFADETNATAGAEPDKDFYIGQSSFPFGDFIEITAVERSPDRLVVKGHYKLVSAEKAQLSLYTTTSKRISVPTDPSQNIEIAKGSGDFTLIHPHVVPGRNHVTMYSSNGRPFAGVYFGNQEEAAAESKMDLGRYRDESSAGSPAPGGSQTGQNGASAESATAPGPNRVLLEYLGNPVAVPPQMDERYTAAGLMAAIQHAASSAGIAVKQVSVDESEFPFLVAVVCGGSDFSQLKAELRKMNGYEYNGSIGNDVNSDGSDTCNAFSLVPYQAYPAGAYQRIYHRLGLRQQVFFDKINGR